MSDITIGTKLVLKEDALVPDDNIQLRCSPNSTLELGSKILTVKNMIFRQDYDDEPGMTVVELEESFKVLDVRRFRVATYKDYK